MRKVIEWCTHHKSDPPSTGDDDDSKTTDIDEWDGEFVQVDQAMLLFNMVFLQSCSIYTFSPWISILHPTLLL